MAEMALKARLPHQGLAQNAEAPSAAAPTTAVRIHRRRRPVIAVLDAMGRDRSAPQDARTKGLGAVEP